MTQLPRKDLFSLPEGVIYLDGNSLGPLPASVPKRLASVVSQEWGQSLIRGWNRDGWMEQPSRIGDRIGALLGAAPGSVVLGDTLSIKVFQALASAMKMRPDRRVILSDTGNFPSDLYMARGLIGMLGDDYELRLADPEDLIAQIDDSVAAVLFTDVDYRTGRLHDVEAVTSRAHGAGAVVVRDLAHSAGAIPVDLAANGCEFAVGCTYKYLNGGPGSPGFIYVRPDLADEAVPALSGWLGHEAPFAFDLDYRPGTGIERMRVGTPPVLQMSALEQALTVWDGVGMDDLRDASIALSDLFIAEVERTCPDLKLVSPRDARQRGSQVSFAFPHGYACMQALIAQGVIGDFRAPDIMRFGFTPLYLDENDIHTAVHILASIIAAEAYLDPAFQKKSRVT